MISDGLPAHMQSGFFLYIKSESRRSASTGTGGLADNGALFAPFRKGRSDPRGCLLQLDGQK